MISVWLGDRVAGPVCVWLSWIGARSLIGALVCGSERWFVDRSAGSWIGALVHGSELWFVDRSSFSLVRGSELSGSWIGLDRSSGSLGRSSFSISLCVAVRGSDLSGSWIGVDRRYEMWIGARSLFLSVLLCVDRSSLCCCVCVCFVFRFSLLSVLLCVESDPKMN